MIDGIFYTEFRTPADCKNLTYFYKNMCQNYNTYSPKHTYHAEAYSTDSLSLSPSLTHESKTEDSEHHTEIWTLEDLSAPDGVSDDQ